MGSLYVKENIMFSDCTNITELNKKRIELMSKPGANILEINNSYNVKRQELNNPKVAVSHLTKIVPVSKNFPHVCTIPIIHGDNPNIIKLTSKGFIL